MEERALTSPNLTYRLTPWLPKSFLALRGYNGKKLGADLAAGITVGLVALPLSMAFAIASGAPPGSGSLHRGGRRLCHLRAGRVA